MTISKYTCRGCTGPRQLRERNAVRPAALSGADRREPQMRDGMAPLVAAAASPPAPRDPRPLFSPCSRHPIRTCPRRRAPGFPQRRHRPPSRLPHGAKGVCFCKNFGLCMSSGPRAEIGTLLTSWFAQVEKALVRTQCLSDVQSPKFLQEKGRPGRRDHVKRYSAGTQASGLLGEALHRPQRGPMREPNSSFRLGSPISP